MAGVVRKAVKDSPGAVGLAVIVTNDYSTNPLSSKLDELLGTSKDGQALHDAFKDLKFAVCWKENVDIGTFGAVISDISSLPHHLVKHFQCIIFVFAGHGDTGDIIYMQDGSEVHVEKAVVTPLLPENAKEIGNIQKAFLIDACRGKEDTPTAIVPRNNSRSGCATEETGERGGSVVSYEIPKGSGILLAHSTLRSYKSYETKEVGGVWLSTVAKLLKEKKYLFSLEYLLTKANEEIMEGKNGGCSELRGGFQQPVRSTTLNKIICLDPKRTLHGDVGDAGMIAAKFSGGQSSRPGDHVKDYVLLLSRYLRPRGVKITYIDLDQYEEKHSHTYYSSKVTIEGCGEWRTPVSYATLDLARDAVAKMAYQSLTNPSSPSAATPVQQTSPKKEEAPKSPSASAGTSSEARVPASSPSAGKPNCVTLLNQFCEKNKVTQKSAYVEDQSTGKSMYKCTVTCLLKGKTITGNSERFYLRREDAKEKAAHNILIAIKKQQQHSK